MEHHSPHMYDADTVIQSTGKQNFKLMAGEKKIINLKEQRQSYQTCLAIMFKIEKKDSLKNLKK